jgi:hypothetical protein
MPTRTQQIQSKAIEILLSNPQGVRYSKLVNEIKASLPDVPINTIHGAVWNLGVTRPKEVYKAARGLFRHASFKDTPGVAEEGGMQPVSAIDETKFYQSFANYLKGDLQECTDAKALGGNVFGDKWGTPDVIGVEKPKPSDIVKHWPVIVSAEIKTDTSGLITAFGQACAYKIFSHKTYIVVPKGSSEKDRERLESLCMIFGIGLIFFDSTNTETPQFEIRVRPLKHEPDMYYVNEYMKNVEELFT